MTKLLNRMRKGIALGAAPAAILALVLIGLVVVVGVKVNTQLVNNELTTGYVYDNTTSVPALMAKNSTAGIQQISQNLTLIGLIIAMAIVIGILYGAFGGMFRGSEGV